MSYIAYTHYGTSISVRSQVAMIDYKEEAANLAADLVNTVGSVSGTDYMPDLHAFRDFLRAHGLDPRAATEDDLAAVQEARARLRAVFFAPDDGTASSALNSLLGQSGARPQLSNHDGSWHLHFVSDSASVGERVVIVSAMGLATLLADFGRERLGICQADDCEDVFVDTSRNRSRRYCTDTCSSRTNVAAYRARRQSTSPS
jgi:predicted RNA-binding Zn ribbon-like protein